ncbi:ABC transporter ATP-binding protein [Cerasibacillus sp. JNUCC 74]|jgi:ABC-2 type transport system ATP-binding protein|uniref:ABC transporter ATP-binding protein n=1 Tax=Virgibacillus proomii TaxID=84407 RepID=UPI0009846777|nr:ABC transporter ATP-binding protein [Virgibacillus proomii]
MKDQNRTILEVSNLVKKIGQQHILQNISFKIPGRSKVGFLGLNGAGKTTTLMAISHIISVDEGNIVIDGKQMAHDNSNSIMFLPDNPLVYPVLKGNEYLSFMSELLDFDIQETYPLIEKLSLQEVINRKIGDYSLGMKKKISLIPLLIKNPKVMLLDEFISNIDPISMREIKKELNTYVQKGNSLVLSTHQLDVVQNYCDYVLIINQGKIVSNLTRVSEILQTYGSLEEYFEGNIE